MMYKSGIYISFSSEHTNVEVSHKDSSVLDVALNNKISISHTCGGMGTCGTCLLKVVEKSELVAERNEIEQEMAEDRGYASDERLACQIEPVAGLVVKVLNPED